MPHSPDLKEIYPAPGPDGDFLVDGARQLAQILLQAYRAQQKAPGTQGAPGATRGAEVRPDTGGRGDARPRTLVTVARPRR